MDQPALSAAVRQCGHAVAEVCEDFAELVNVVHVGPEKGLANALQTICKRNAMPSLGVNLDHIAKVINNGYKGVEQLA